MKYKYYVVLLVFALLITIAPPICLFIFKFGLSGWIAAAFIGYVFWLFYGLQWIVFDIKVKYNE